MAPISDDNLKTPKGSDKIIKKKVKKHTEEELQAMSKASDLFSARTSSQVGYRCRITRAIC